MNIQYVQLEKPFKRWHVYRSLVGLGLICVVIIVSVYYGTLPAIQFNKEQALSAAIARVLPSATNVLTYTQTEFSGFQPVSSGSMAQQTLIHAGYDAQHHLVGLAIEAQGMGYQDAIGLLYGYLPERQYLNGFVVLQSRETPGLGSKIETDKKFLKAFQSLDVALNADGTRLAHAIVPVKKAKPRFAGQIDTITGATVSSRAVITIIGESAQHWIPIVQRQLEDFTHAQPTQP